MSREEDLAIQRIKAHRFERGQQDAIDGEPPTEANAEYQAGYLRSSNSSLLAWNETIDAAIIDADIELVTEAHEALDGWQSGLTHPLGKRESP